MNEIEIKNAIIESTQLGVEDHGIFTFWLMLDYGGSGQGAGGYGLDDWNEKKQKRIGTAYGLNMIMKILDVVGVDYWEDLPGKSIRVKANRGKVLAIGNYLQDEWLDFETYKEGLKEVKE